METSRQPEVQVTTEIPGEVVRRYIGAGALELAVTGEEARQVAPPADPNARDMVRKFLGDEALPATLSMSQGQAETLFEQLFVPAFIRVRQAQPNSGIHSIQDRINETRAYVRGGNYRDIAERFRMSPQNINTNVRSFVGAVRRGYSPEYLLAVIAQATETGAWPELAEPNLPARNNRPHVAQAKPHHTAGSISGERHVATVTAKPTTRLKDTPELEPSEPAGVPEDELDETETGQAAGRVRRGGETSTEDLVRVYLNEIGKTPLLDAAEEVELSKRIEAGLAAEHILIVRNKAEKPEAYELLRAGTKARRKYLEPGDEGYADTPENQKAGKQVEQELQWLQAQADNIEKLPTRDLDRLKREGEQAKNDMLKANLRLVVSLAKRYTGHGMPFSDLIQEGNLGLIRGVEKFDYAKGYKFSTYATWWIRQAITRAMADQARTIRIPVHMVEVINKMARINREMTQELGRDPTPEELAKELDITPDRVLELQSYSREPASFDQTVGTDDDATLGDFIADKMADTADDMAFAGERRQVLLEVIGTLDAREQTVIKMRYGLDNGQPKTLDEIGAHLELSRERIRQIERDLMAKLRHPSRSQVLRDYLGTEE